MLKGSGHGTAVDSMWNKNIARRTENETLRDGRMYLACDNPRGLLLIAGERCELRKGEPGTAEVWLGRFVPKAKSRPS